MCKSKRFTASDVEIKEMRKVKGLHFLNSPSE